MKLLETEPPDFASRGYLLLGAQTITLFVTGCVVWIAVAAPPFFRDSLLTITGRAVACALLAWIWSAATLAGLLFLFAEPISDHLRCISRTATAAVWFAPATILLTEQSAAAMLAALILAVSTTRALYSEWPLAQAEPNRSLPVCDPDGLFQHYDLRSPTFTRQLASAMKLAYFVQAGAIAAIMHYPLLAAGCFAFRAAFLTACGMAAGILPPERPRDLPRSILGVILTVLLAAGLALGGSPSRLIPGSNAAVAWSSRRPPGLVEMARALLGQWLYGGKLRTLPKSSGTPQGQPGPPMPGYEPAVGANKIGDNDFPGVILWPEVKTVTTLVAPLPAWTGFSARAARPLGIPFSGEYWMFREPYRRPPYGSFFQRGSPAWIGFFTTDHAPLHMEAHHKLDQPIDLRCCNKIQITIWNADRYPGTVALEIILIDAKQPRRLSQSLGTAAVRSSPGALPVRETLEFPIPIARAVEQCSAFKVVFHRDRKRAHSSARIEIDRFVLVPRRGI